MQNSIRPPKEKPESRLSWDDFFMDMVEQAGKRSACIYYKVAAIFVDDLHHILGFGYSGPTAGDFHCSEAGVCLKVHGDPITGEIKRCNGAHAEMNAIANSPDTSKLRGSTLYLSIYPCYDCMKILNNVGVKRIVYKEDYRRLIDGSLGEKEERERESEELAAKRGIITERYSSLDSQKVKKAKSTKLPEEMQEKLEEIEENTKW